MFYKAAALLLAAFFLAGKGLTQAPANKFEHLLAAPKRYVATYAKKAPVIDGRLTDAAWQQAAWTDHFADIEGEKKPKPYFDTRAKMLWTDSCLYLAAELKEPHVWATLKRHDAIIYHDNDFEVFLDPDNNTHQYFEIEVNALNTVLDLFMNKPYRNGGTPMLAYDVPGLKTAVSVQGTLNNPADKDSGWTVEIAIPFRSVSVGAMWRPPHDGEVWRINFSRVQWETEVVNNRYVKRRGANGNPLPENNWVWSPQGVIDMHYPERWGYLQFSKGSTLQAPETPVAEKLRPYLWWLYYRQRAYLAAHGRFARTLAELGPAPASDAVEEASVEATTRQFTITVTGTAGTATINEEGFVRTIK